MDEFMRGAPHQGVRLPFSTTRISFPTGCALPLAEITMSKKVEKSAKFPEKIKPLKLRYYRP
ncbi:hypothetical protein INR77_09280 [Erythrobacter sp. SCSIO 43205]|uniref:hypothetical protein n=1 Tax=Erythrobacter sp. SCSIO 43205 TaxID=2779361 RepID=UPI001CA8C181|nr:hypothetical protein [Erythrobacter sp. SCSIO 43205]UAB77032.1 hypothetical protein INR77_09280 [Erythrobacter sp. SCSIO 43205]